MRKIKVNYIGLFEAEFTFNEEGEMQKNIVLTHLIDKETIEIPYGMFADLNQEMASDMYEEAVTQEQNERLGSDDQN